MKYTCAKTKPHQECLDIIHNLEKKIASKKTNLYRQDLARYRAVLSFLKVQIQKPDYTRKEIVKQVVEYYGHGLYVSKENLTWKIQ